MPVVALVPPLVSWHAGTMRALVVAVLVLGVAAPAAAHMVVQPATSEAGSWERYAVIVPTEKKSPTVRVELKLPLGMEVAAVEAKPGWQGTYRPFPAGAATVQWQGGRIPSGEFVTFEFLAWNPPAPRTITWVATQWYEDGSSDVWGAKGDEEHASTTTLRPGSAKPDHRHHPPKQSP
jgi:uncharacterized protein YcnI